MSLGERLKKSRQEKGLTQVEAARALGITNTALSNYERGERDPDTSLLKRLSELYGVTADYLLGNADPQEFDLMDILENKDINITIGKRNLSWDERVNIIEMLSRFPILNTNNTFSDSNFTDLVISTGKPAEDNLYYSDIDKKLDKTVIVASHQGRQVMQQVSPVLRELIKQEIVKILEERKDKNLSGNKNDTDG
ncbi:MAG TPA: hypothetical protein DEF36_01140 [Desulfotomaculum sp.]|nr:hypothetical protein [Desulfotomaculum sp.]